MLLADPVTTFNFAFEANDGEGSRQVFRAIMYAKDLGGDKEYVLQLVEDIQNYWVSPFSDDRQSKLVSQIDGIFR